MAHAGDAVTPAREASGSEELREAAEVARAALTLDPGEGPALVDRLANPPAGRRWTALVIEGGVVMASVSAKDPAVGHIDLLAVHPDVRGRGHGRELVRAAEEWLRSAGATQARFGGNPPCYAWPGIDVRYTAAACLAESLGYERYHMAWNMTADLGTDLSVDDDLVRLARGVCTSTRPSRCARASLRRGARRSARSCVSTGTRTGPGRPSTPPGCTMPSATAGSWGSPPGGRVPPGSGRWGRRPRRAGSAWAACCCAAAWPSMRAAGQSSAQISWVGPLRFYSRAVGARAERVFWLYRRELA